jgi:[ribosomal protein S18]-alanine N-acetyltransferase
MAVLRKIREIWRGDEVESEVVVPAPATTYSLAALTTRHLDEVCRLNRRCFPLGDSYTRHTFNFLLSEPNGLAMCVLTPSEKIVAFIVVMVNSDGAGHVTTLGVAPEHRRRGLAEKLLQWAEEALRKREINLVRLEVRVSNIAAQKLYKNLGYAAVQRLSHYYVNGDDGFLMVKSLAPLTHDTA